MEAADPLAKSHQVRRRFPNEPRGVGVVTPRPEGRENFGGQGSGGLVKGASTPKSSVGEGDPDYKRPAVRRR